MVQPMQSKLGAVEVAMDDYELGLIGEDATFEDLETLHKVYISSLFLVEMEKIDRLRTLDKRRELVVSFLRVNLHLPLLFFYPICIWCRWGIFWLASFVEEARVNKLETPRR